MDEVGVASRPRRRPPKGGHHRRKEHGAEGSAPQVPDDSRTVRDAVVAEPKRRNDFDLEPATAQPLDRLADEVAGRIPLVAGIRRREHGDLQGRTTGSSSS